ncbi:MAG: hypothetical protein AB7G48_10770 [Nitrospiraceae bacterium]
MPDNDRRRILRKSEQLQFFQTLTEGLETLLKQHDPDTYKRYRVWVEEFLREYAARRGRDGQTAALKWALQQARNPRLPDMRARRADARDQAMLAEQKHLKETLPGIWRNARRIRNQIARTRELADALTKLLGRRIAAADLQGLSTPVQVRRAFLGASDKRLYRARKRTHRIALEHLRHAVMALQAASVDTEDRGAANKAKRALQHLKDKGPEILKGEFALLFEDRRST